MSRRKQAKPQCVHLDAHQVSAEHLDYSVKHISSAPCDVRVCERCCAEFFNLPDLQEHQMSCSKNPLVLIVSENGSPASPSLSFTFSSPPHNVEEPMNDSMSNEDSEGLHDFSKDKTPEANKESTLMSEANSCDNGAHSRSDNENGVGNGSTSTAMLSSVFSSVLPQADSPPDLGNVSSSSSNVFIENLESTSVAVAQFNQEVSVNAEVSSSSPSSCTVAFPGLIEQLITLQQQQVQQLKLIEEIQHQMLLLAAQSTETSASSSVCQGSSGIPHTGPLIKLSSHLSQQLAAAAGLAQSLASQSARISNVKQLKHADLSSHHDSNEVLSSTDISQMTDTDRSKLLISRLGTYPPKNQCTPDSTPCRSGGATNSPSHFSRTDSTNSIKKFSLPHSPTGNHIFSKTLPSIGEIVEDLNALTALAQQRKGKIHHLTSFEYKRPFEEGLFKHKCRFCAKVFGSDSALQIHLRSHTGERPYKCNICGNRFSTRGNLKVHFQRHKEKYPDIQMNPYPVPEHLDNVPTSTGIPYGMSMPPNKPIFNWLDSKSSVTNLTGLLLPSSLPSLPNIIKTEEQMVLIDRPSSNLNGFDTFERRNKNKDEFSSKHFLTIEKNIPVSINTVKDGLETNTSVDSASTNVNSLIPLLSEDFKPKLCGGFPDSIEASETTKLQQLVENIDRKCTGSDSNECMVCHRVLSCQSALKMHYRTHTGERPFKCRLCGRAFTTKGNLKTHYSIHRAMPPLKVQHSCPICQDKFTNAMMLQQHIRMHMVGHISNMTFPESYQDTIKRDIFSVERKNLDDQRSVLDENMEITEAISDSKASSSPLESLCSSPTSAQTFESENQIKVLQENDLLNDKLENGPMGGNSLILRSSSVDGNVSQRLRSPVLSEATSFCNSLSPQSSAVENDTSLTYETHYRSSVELTTTDLLQSNFTGANSLDSVPADTLKDGTIMISPTRGLVKSNACDICNKTFACQSALDIHYRSHTKERPFLCTVCNRGFSTRGNLKQHMLTHQMRDLPSQLFEHANQSHPPQPNSPHQFISSKTNMGVNGILNRDGKDSIVGAGACSSPSLPVLAAPLRRTPKQHFCHTCGKMFSSSSALQIHERTHTGEKPFSCTICGRAFTTKGNLKVHMGTHMWNCPPARRGRRLSINDPIKFLKSNPVKVPETLPKNSISGVCNGDSTNVWNQYATTALANGLETKPNEISVIQNGGIQHLSVSVGNGRNPPMDGLTENVEKQHNVNVKTSLPWLEKLGESRTSLNFTQLIEDSKTD